MSFSLTVLPNAPPSFASALASQYYLSYAADTVYTLPETIDPDSYSIFVTLGSGLPSFISLDQPNIINIKPTEA
jgi:hypothetical protein